MVDVDLGNGGGGGFGLGTAIARGGGAVAPTGGVSDDLADERLCGVGDFSGPGLAFFFFFDFDIASFAADFFGFAVASGVSLGVGEVADSSAGVFFFLGFGAGVGDFFLCAELFGFGVGVGDSSVVDEARAFKNFSRFSSSVVCP